VCGTLPSGQSRFIEPHPGEPDALLDVDSEIGNAGYPSRERGEGQAAYIAFIEGRDACSTLSMAVDFERVRILMGRKPQGDSHMLECKPHDGFLRLFGICVPFLSFRKT